MTEDATRQRADAKANRARILDVARDAFAATPDASLNSIAKAAGIGPGTLYRHFPTREALVLGVYRHEIDTLVQLAHGLTASHPPLKAFRLWCDRLAQYGRVKHGLTDVLHSAAADPVHAEVYGPMVEAMGHLVSACQGAGEFRSGIEAEDVLLLLAFLWRPRMADTDRGRSDRMLTLVVEGLRAR
ncbi:TetR/AcrR family transcriptional regulator [Aurantimonas sp. MSK8Z-1]|uniref:TetR/AcrR family transcriptional regulator n=1 Tax=Mangrovibrevibacter kandeliae TaxID=2968473 RepID=UPI002117C424|nr:TetR/AcrR family transcriptional regulator [Aurantimonas sp. MSK8Z-1]MCW4115045.1 TetR/AcrR family transcriptional regulator [Aurantimonas sp. MSK8Z-1]